MNRQSVPDQKRSYSGKSDNRLHLLTAIPATEHQIDLAGLLTAVLTGGEGPPIILLHGPGESSVWWMRVIPKLVQTHRVIIPDLPGHGSSKMKPDETPLNAEFIDRWLSELIEKSCPTPPVLAGHLLGGSIAARFAIEKGDRLNRLVLVNSFGLGKFRPAPGFAFRLLRFIMRPTQENYQRFLPQCIYDPDNLRAAMGKNWDPFLAYNLNAHAIRIAKPLCVS